MTSADAMEEPVLMKHRTLWADSSPALQDHDHGDGVSFSTMDVLVQSSSRPYELLHEGDISKDEEEAPDEEADQPFLSGLREEKISREEHEDAQREDEEVRHVESDQPLLPGLLDDCGEQVAEAEHGDSQNVHDRLHQEVLRQEYGERDLEVAEGSPVKSEEGTSQHETEIGTAQQGVEVNAQQEVLDHPRERASETGELLPHHGVGAREEEVLEQLSRESAPETLQSIALQVVEADGQQEILTKLSTERPPEATGASKISAPENGGCLAVRHTVAAAGRAPQVLEQPFDKNLREDIFGEGPALVGQVNPEAPRNERGALEVEAGRRSLDQVVWEATGASNISAPENGGCLAVRQTVAVAGRVPQVQEQTFDKNLREDVFGEGPAVVGQLNPEAPRNESGALEVEVEAARRSLDQVVWGRTSACSALSPRDEHEDLNHENEDDLEDEFRKIRESHRFRSRAHTVEHRQALRAVEELLATKEDTVHDVGGDEKKRAPRTNQSDMKTFHVGRREKTAAHDDVREMNMSEVAPARVGGTEPEVDHAQNMQVAMRTTIEAASDEDCRAPGCPRSGPPQREARPSRNFEQVTEEMPEPVLVQADDHQPHHLLAFIVQVPPDYPGLQYRRSKNIDDRLEFYEASGKGVYGYLEDRGKWLHVRTGLYLPVEVGNSRVLYPVMRPEGVKPTGGLGALNSSTNELPHPPTAGVAVGVDSDQPQIGNDSSEVDGGGGFWSFLCCFSSAWSTDGNRRRDAVDATDLILTDSR